MVAFWNCGVQGYGWKQDKIEHQGLEFAKCLSFVNGLGRALGPLVKYYKTTGSSEALRLAIQIKDKLISNFYPSDGSFDEKTLGFHSHSVTCCLSSLAQMADLTNDGNIMEHVKSFYDNGLKKMRDEIGWSPEQTKQTNNGQTDHGETNNSGDIVETALILGKWGWDEYYNDAERILRAHILPSQLRDVSFITEPENPNNIDGLRDMAKRHKGAWGFPAPYGSTNPSITAEAAYLSIWIL